MARLAQTKDPFWQREFQHRTEHVIPISFKENQVAVLMEMQSKESNDTYDAIKKGCRIIDLEAIRVDEKYGAGIIMKDIDLMMSYAEYLIFDLSNERPNVYYELGYAHGIGNGAYNILIIAREGTRIHFDVSPLRIHFYNSLDNLKALVASQLKELKTKKQKETVQIPLVESKPWWKFW